MSADAADTRRELEGELSFATTPDLYRDSLVWFAQPSLTVDFSNVSKADSAGLALMTEWRRLAKEKNCQLDFLNVPTQVQELIRVNGLQDVLLNSV